MESSARTDLGKRLLAERTARGWSQRAAGDYFGLSNASYNKWEIGQGRPALTTELLKRLAEFLSLDQAETEHLLIQTEIELNTRRASR